ncbi:hypothetical protein Btru_008463 [Bulinus truncatus]|nr:hypothetical protein Btru_008463 [Bulinus truncatus]
MFICGFEDILTSLTLVLNLLPDTIFSARCPQGWIGPTCSMECYCSNNDCDEDLGTCLNGGKCRKDFFGTACQYANVVSCNPLVFFISANVVSCNPLVFFISANVVSMSNGTTGDLFDQDDSTCAKDEKGPVTLQFDRELRFTFTRLVLQDIANLNNVEISFTHKDATKSKCQSYTYLFISSTTLDIHCQMEKLFSAMIISWSGDVTLCGIYVSGGRKLYASAIESTSTFKERIQASKITDGLVESCFFPETTDVHAYWDISFSGNVVFYRVSVQGCPDCMITTGGQNYSKHDTSRLGTDYMEWSIKQESVPPKLRVTFLSNAPDVKLCDLVAYGDCQRGYQGFDCSTKCKGQCPRDICHLTDNNCASCQPLTYGSECEKNCPYCDGLGLCDNINGACLDGCKPGTDNVCKDPARGDRFNNATGEKQFDGEERIQVWVIYIVLIATLVITLFVCLLFMGLTKRDSIMNLMSVPENTLPVRRLSRISLTGSSISTNTKPHKRSTGSSISTNTKPHKRSTGSSISTNTKSHKRSTGSSISTNTKPHWLSISTNTKPHKRSTGSSISTNTKSHKRSTGSSISTNTKPHKRSTGSSISTNTKSHKRSTGSSISTNTKPHWLSISTNTKPHKRSTGSSISTNTKSHKRSTGSSISTNTKPHWLSISTNTKPHKRKSAVAQCEDMGGDTHF